MATGRRSAFQPLTHRTPGGVVTLATYKVKVVGATNRRKTQTLKTCLRERLLGGVTRPALR